MSNINNQGVLFQSVNPIDNTGYIALSNSWFNIYKNAVEKLTAAWDSWDKEQLKTEVSKGSFTTYGYWFADLKYYYSKIEALQFADFKSLRLYQVPNLSGARYSFEGEHFFNVHKQIVKILDTRIHDSLLKTALPKINFPIVRFRRAQLPQFVYYNSRIPDLRLSLLVKQFEQVRTVTHSVTVNPNNSFIKQRNYSALGTNLQDILHKDHLTDLVAVINHLIDIKHISSNGFEETIEQLIDENLGLLTKLRPEFPIRPALAKKVLLAKLI